LLAGRAVRDICPAATLPTDPHPLVKFVKINVTGEHQQARGDEFLTSAGRIGEPGPSDHAGAFGADVITALRHLAEMINQRLQFRPSRGQQGFAVECGAQGLVFGGHSLSVADATDGWSPNHLHLVPCLWPTTWFCGWSIWVPMSRTGPMYLGGTVKVIRRIAMTTLAAAGLFVSMTGPAAADVIEDVPEVAPHKHCLLTPNGWVPIAEGVSEEADEQDTPALDQLHDKVHFGTPTDDGGPLRIVRVSVADENCSSAPPIASAE
jgi:hypothetical protein